MILKVLFVTCLSFGLLSCNGNDENATRDFRIQIPRTAAAPALQVSSPLIGAWRISTMSAIGWVQIVFYADASCYSNLWGSGKFSIQSNFVRIISETGTLDIGCQLSGDQLNIQFPDGIVIPFVRVPAVLLKILVGEYCSSDFDRTSLNKTSIEFDGMGCYSINGQRGACWVDEGGIHLIFLREGFGTDMFFRFGEFDASGTIHYFTGRDASFTRCR